MKQHEFLGEWVFVFCVVASGLQCAHPRRVAVRTFRYRAQGVLQGVLQCTNSNSTNFWANGSLSSVVWLAWCSVLRCTAGCVAVRTF